MALAVTACEYCTNEFTYKPRRGAVRRYCSRSCWASGQVKRDRPLCPNCHEREVRCKGLCMRCYGRLDSIHGLAGPPARPTNCSICGSTPVVSRGWCGRHYWSFNRHGDPLEIDRRDARIYVDNHGYLRQGNRGLVHRFVMERLLGRRLTRGEVVHHINGEKLDNAGRNLHLYPSQSAHKRAHGSLERCAFALVASGAIRFDSADGTYYLTQSYDVTP